MASRQAQLAAQLRSLQAALGDDRNVTWEADQALKRLRGSVYRARSEGVATREVQALLEGALGSVARAERERQAAIAAVGGWLAVHDAHAGGAGGGGEGAGASGGSAAAGPIADLLAAARAAPRLLDGVRRLSPQEGELAGRMVVEMGAAGGAVFATDLLAAFMLGLAGGPACVAVASLAGVLGSQLAEALGFGLLIEHASLRASGLGSEHPAGEWLTHNDWRTMAAVLAAGALATALLGAADVSLWAVIPVASAFGVAGWILPKKTFPDRERQRRSTR